MDRAKQRGLNHRSRERLRLAVGHALHNLRKPDLLEEDNALHDVLQLSDEAFDGYWPRGSALAAAVAAAALTVVEKLSSVERYQRHRDLLRAIVEDGASIASFARTNLGISREQASRAIFAPATQLVLDELLRQQGDCEVQTERVYIRKALGGATPRNDPWTPK